MAETTDAIQRELAKYEPGKYHVLLPKSVALQACTWIIPHPSVVEINPNPEAGDIYPVGGKDEDDDGGETAKRPGSKFGLAKPAIMRFANAAGIDFDPDRSKALSASADYVLYRAVADMRGPDGTRMTGTSTKEIDLRVKEAEIREQKRRAAQKWKWTAERTEQAIQYDLLQWRKNKFMRAETGAQERVVKALLAMRPAYTLPELALPFVVVRFDINFDHSEIKKMFAAQGNFAAQALYGGRGAKLFVGTAATVIDADAVVRDDPDEEPAPIPTAPDQKPPTPAPETPTQPDPAPAAPQSSNLGVPAKPAGTEPATESKPATSECEDCHAKIGDGVATFSRRKFGKTLCMKCQKKPEYAGGAAQ